MSGAPFDAAYEFGRPEMPSWPTGQITTASGRRMNLLAPKPEDIKLIDLATGLGNCCRWGKQCKFYSTAEHSALMADWLATAYPGQKLLPLWALLHDGSDFVLPDVPSPYKHALRGFVELERAMQGAIYAAFGLAIDDYPVPVGVADKRIRADEALQAMRCQPIECGVEAEGLGVALQFWAPDQAATEWIIRMDRFAHIWREKGLRP